MVSSRKAALSGARGSGGWPAEDEGVAGGPATTDKEKRKFPNRMDPRAGVTGYGEINYRDRALIVTILLAAVAALRLIQVVLSFAAYRSLSNGPKLFEARHLDKADHGGRLSRARELAMSSEA